MEAFYNELSNYPLASNEIEARERIIFLLQTMKCLKEYDINILRTHNHFFAEKVSPTYLFSDFFGDSQVSPTLKILLRTIIANPYIEDDDSLEADLFITNTYTTIDHAGNSINPEGIASAFVFDAPVVSIGAEICWQKEYLHLTVSENNISSAIFTHHILNIFSERCLSTDGFKSWWAKINPPVPLNTRENIYAFFSSANFEFEQKAIEDIISWFHDDRRYLMRIKELIDDIPLNPFSGGKGKTEVLKKESGKASKRIVKKDRVVYTYTRTKIIIHRCRGHYI